MNGAIVPKKDEGEDQFEMLKALYDYTATFAKTLSFREGDIFIFHQSSTRQRNWWQVVNSEGQVGYVPSNYVTSIQVGPECWIQFLDKCLKSLKEEGTRDGRSPTPECQELQLKLTERKRIAELCLEKQNASPSHSVIADASSPVTQKTNGDIKLMDNSRECEKKTAEHTVYGAESKADGDSAKESLSLDATSSKSIDMNAYTEPSVAYCLVEQVRKHTQLSHEKSCVAVAIVLEGLTEILPESLHEPLTAVLANLKSPLAAPQLIMEETHDARRLKVIFTELTSCKEDSQQRSWMLYEDEATIVEYIQELISILTNADASISRHVMAIDKFQAVSNLVQYYQMEVRWTIRQLLLKAFGVMCNLDAVVVALMLNSILPMELARDMCANSKDISRLKYSSLLLTMIFSMGEPMPVTHLEQLDEEFLTFLFDQIENPPDTDVDEQIPDLFLNLVLSYNLQFTLSTENVVLKALLKRTVAKTFTEKVLLLLNREDDPVRMFEHQPAPQHSVLKLFVDLFSNAQIATLFYTNDTKVLIDIIVRQLADLSPGDKRRCMYLQLCQLVVRNTSYSDHRHRQDDILRCFTQILCEESEQSKSDQQLVQKISDEFPHMFSS